ncbi:cinnamoyl-CoA reductase 1-like [Neltuma alba]|uniref:cinnamoyl-CoA reductase 1-like n=1 Tax=Neltuma alba TaxID=207710 RepID=UPI0010A35ABF|nr:cinnamoyl-CoA reductase 1-like [Prosopis alba]
MTGAATKVCVTGAGGFLASWLVKLLLSKGYFVHGTVREPGNKKYDHLLKFDGASENLKLFKAELSDYESLSRAIAGCRAVFHVACPVPATALSNPEVEMIEPSVTGTINVLKACLEAKVERVVYVSSQFAVSTNPNFPKDAVFDESCWSDKEYCKKTENWYNLCEDRGGVAGRGFCQKQWLSLVTICPGVVFGPILQASTVNTSSLALLVHLKVLVNADSVENKQVWLVDVRDVADATLMIYEKPEAEGRYLCTAHGIMPNEVAEKLRRIYPNYAYPKSFVEVGDRIKLSSEKLQKLGWRYRPLEETLVDSVESFKAAGLLEAK